MTLDDQLRAFDDEMDRAFARARDSAPGSREERAALRRLREMAEIAGMMLGDSPCAA